MLSMRDWIWIACIVAGIAFTNGMLSSRVTALESNIKDFDMLRIDARLAVIEEQLKQMEEMEQKIRREHEQSGGGQKRKRKTKKKKSKRKTKKKSKRK